MTQAQRKRRIADALRAIAAGRVVADVGPLVNAGFIRPTPGGGELTPAARAFLERVAP